MFKTLYVSLLEVLLVAGLVVFFASFALRYLSGFFTLGLFVVGRSEIYSFTLTWSSLNQ